MRLSIAFVTYGWSFGTFAIAIWDTSFAQTWKNMLKYGGLSLSRRRGYPPLMSGETIFAIGDIHGRADLLDVLHSQIDAEAARCGDHVLEIYLGDYVDRGSRSAGVIERLVRRARDRRAQMLSGNHEALFLQALEGSLGLRDWARFGGLHTLESYGVLANDWRHGGDWRGRLRAQVPPEHVKFLHSLSSFAWRGGYFFAHAGVRPGVPLQDQTPDDLYWIRREFLDDERDHGAVVVHGHTPTPTPELRRNRINLDTGAFMSGRLSCLRIDRQGARLFGGEAGVSSPVLAPAAPAFSVPAFGEGSLLARACRAGASIAYGWRSRKAELTKNAYPQGQ